MEKIKVEVTLEGGFKEGYIQREFGDVFSSENGQTYVDLGWCKNVETGEQGEIDLTPKKVQIHNVITDMKVK